MLAAPNNITTSSINITSKLLPLKSILLTLVLMLASFGGGAFYVYNYVPHLVKPVLIQDLSTASTQRWGQIVIDAAVQYSLKGSITDMKLGAIRGGEPGREVTLKQGTDIATVFVSEQASVFKGQDYRNSQGWTETNVADLKTGDQITIRAQAPIVNNLQNLSFRGWWIFKQI